VYVVQGSITYLFDLGEVVERVLVKNEFPDGAEWVVFVRPDLGKIEDVVAELFSLFGGHGLLLEAPHQSANYDLKKGYKLTM
jgi:hypothetical protein